MKNNRRVFTSAIVHMSNFMTMSVYKTRAYRYVDGRFVNGGVVYFRISDDEVIY